FRPRFCQLQTIVPLGQSDRRRFLKPFDDGALLRLDGAEEPSVFRDDGRLLIECGVWVIPAKRPRKTLNLLRPNRRTVLTNRILVVAAADPAATAYELVLVLAKDQNLPADTRVAIARKALLFGRSRSMHSRSVAPNGHGRPPSKPGTEIGSDHEANKGPAS